MNLFNMGSLFFSIGVPQVSNLSGINFQQITDTNFLQALQSQIAEQPLFAGVFDPASIVQGMGLGSDNVPKPPPVETYQSLFLLQADNMKLQQDSLSQAQFEIGQKKEKVFAQSHYEFDENGKPLRDEESGQIKLFEGAENPIQRSLRQTWEHREQKLLTDQQDAEAKAYQEQSKARLEAAQKYYNDNPGDPEASTRLQQVNEENQQGEAAMKYRQVKDQLLLGTEGLPDLDSIPPAESLAEGEVAAPTRSLSEFALEKYDEYLNLVDNHSLQQQSSPEYQSISGFFNTLQTFIDEQKRQMTEMGIETGETIDLDAMRKLQYGQF